MPVDEAALIAAVAGAVQGSITANVGHRPARVAVAVSGGGDSTALLHLAVRAGLAPLAVTVDHGLRPGSAAEAAGVAEVCARLGVPHETLRWAGPKAAGNLMDQARQARAALIGAWARAAGVEVVLLGHTADDVAETFVMNLARGTGIDGLLGLRSRWVAEGLEWSRPLLDTARADLRDWLRGQGIPWVDDPTNEDDRFARARARKALAVLGRLGVTPARIGEVAVSLRSARAMVLRAVGKAADAHVTERAGALFLSPDGLAAMEQEVRRRILIAMVRWIGGTVHPPREAQVTALIARIRRGQDATLGGVWFRSRDGVCTVLRERRHAGGPVPLGRVWDGRWTVTGATGEVRALGPEGLRQCPDWRSLGLPRQVLEVTPGLWQGDVLLAAPCAGFGPAAATCAPGFHAFLLSH